MGGGQQRGLVKQRGRGETDVQGKGDGCGLVRQLSGDGGGCPVCVQKEKTMQTDEYDAVER